MYYKQDYKEYLDNQIVKYDYAIIDPPWNYSSKPPVILQNQLTYSLWDNSELVTLFDKLQVEYIFMWVTNSMIGEVFKALEMGGKFIYKTIFTWVKLTPKGNLFWGLGNTFRNSTEHILVLQRPKAKALNLNMRNVCIEKSGKRTVKPKNVEKSLVSSLAEKGLQGVYIFSGGGLDFIDCVDVVESHKMEITDAQSVYTNKINLFGG